MKQEIRFEVVLSEDQEHKALVEWLELKGLPFFHPPQETFTKSWKQKTRNKAMGVKSGIPDLFVVVPTDKSVGVYNWRNDAGEIVRAWTGNKYMSEHRLIAIELKRTKGGKVSDNQKYWLKTLNSAGIESFVAKGCDEAIKIIEGILGG